MKNFLVILSLFCFGFLGSVQAKHFAVLVAGSNMFYNYRHQSDIFHAYQILTGYGIDPENIITFAYDDIAQDPENPVKGKVYNKPSDGEGKDVYAGVKIDYKGEDVTPKNFIAVLEGNSEAVNGKKVLESGEKDHVFIYFADHGATGLIAFPNEYLYADDFIKALKDMNSKKKYSQMVVYIEACESGSMFNKILPENITIYATTASNPDESSWATYCSPNDVVNGVEIGSCLGDLYSVNFLENLESSDPNKETLLKQFQVVKKKTTASHVMQYGDLALDKEVIGEFEGNSTDADALVKNEREDLSKYTSLVDSRYVKLAYLQRRHARLGSVESEANLAEEMRSIKKFDESFESLSSMLRLNVDEKVDGINFGCLKQRVAMYEEVCGKFSDYGLKYIRYLHFSCVQGVDVYDFEEALIKSCGVIDM